MAPWTHPEHCIVCVRLDSGLTESQCSPVGNTATICRKKTQQSSPNTTATGDSDCWSTLVVSQRLKEEGKIRPKEDLKRTSMLLTCRIRHPLMYRMWAWLLLYGCSGRTQSFDIYLMLWLCESWKLKLKQIFTLPCIVEGLHQMHRERLEKYWGLSAPTTSWMLS